MKEIPLTRGYVALVDDDDFERLSQYKWYVNISSGLHYAHRQYRSETLLNKKGQRKQVLVLMHREVINAPKGLNVDHKDGNGLNNQKGNLRLCTHAQNLRNQRKRAGNGYKGVTRTQGSKYWTVNITVDGTIYYLGMFKCEKSAARTYDKLAKLLHGEYACLNFPDKHES